MADYDIFNGDADGICALIQLRLAEPRDAVLITGVKRDIALLNRVQPQAGERLTVLDMSMQKNQQGLTAALNCGASVLYIDHHQAGDMPQHPLLQTHIHTASNTCTGLIVDYLLQGRFSGWGIVAAYGDNLNRVADDYVARLGFSPAQRTLLHNLGVAMNYNAYGAALNDLFYHPAELFRLAAPYTSPFDFIAAQSPVYQTLTEGFRDDLEQGLSIKASQLSERVALFILPDAPWARRISGVLGNELANRYPQRAHAVLTPEQNAGGHIRYQVSLRAPKSNLRGADVIAAEFDGGGRKGAAGINHLPAEQIAPLFRRLDQYYLHEQ